MNWAMTATTFSGFAELWEGVPAKRGTGPDGLRGLWGVQGEARCATCNGHLSMQTDVCAWGTIHVVVVVVVAVCHHPIFACS